MVEQYATPAECAIIDDRDAWSEYDNKHVQHENGRGARCSI